MSPQSLTSRRFRESVPQEKGFNKTKVGASYDMGTVVMQWVEFQRHADFRFVARAKCRCLVNQVQGLRFTTKSGLLDIVKGMYRCVSACLPLIVVQLNVVASRLV